MLKQETLFSGMHEGKPEPEIKEKKVGAWKVKSWTNGNYYDVNRDGSRWSCTCFYFTERVMKSEGKKKSCKHVDQVKESLGMIKEDLSGFKSGIQKAIRRGDIPLLKLCFSKLWECEPKWISWRLPILAAEETWQYTGIAGRMAWPEPKRDDVWRLLWNMCKNPKNKNAEGLNIHGDKVAKFNEDPTVMIKDPKRMAIFNGWMAIRQKLDLIETDPDTFWGWFLYGENEFAGEIVKIARRRSKFGGTGGDHTLLLAAAYLACVTKIEPIVLDEGPTEEEVEPAKEIPWYAWDMHSGPGKIVFYQMKKILGEEMGEYVAMECWFNIESARTDRLVEDPYFWELCLNAWAKRRGKTRAQTEKDWEQWMPKIRERVEKMIKAKMRPDSCNIIAKEG